ncbi:MAG: oligoendopeptidase F [Lachnospiraceae bacterium]|nr:oligoendopeptidase F [Lachnospiraceae bacterium]
MEKKLPERNEVAEALTWRLEDIYPSREEFEGDMEKAGSLAAEFAKREGHSAQSAADLLTSFDLYEELELLEDRFMEYAMMKQDEDTGNSQSQADFKKAEALYIGIAQQTAFFEPEILELSEETVNKYYEDEPGLRKYEVTIKDIFRKKEHGLSAEMEKTMAAASEMAQVPYSAFGMMANADLTFPSVKTDDGSDVEITNGRFVPLETMSSRPVRKEVFEKYYGTYAQYKDVWAALYDGQVKQQKFFSRMRKYPSNFEAALGETNVSAAVCDNLIDSVHRNMEKMYRYVRLRKKLLGVDELHMYDVYIPIVKDVVWNTTIEEAEEIALKALAPLGEDYVALLDKAFKERWIDVVENKGKRGGAYSSGVYGVHPYVLLNFNGTLDDIFTLVHEMGHSLHTWYSSHAQTLFNARYKIFVAEVASTTNEVLLLEYLLKVTEDPEKQKYLVNHYLESFKSTLFRQTMFEEFERRTNEMGESGIPLTAQTLSEVYYELNKEYFGPDMVSDDEIRYEWCRIPHFYYNFYVYQYATSFSAAVAIARRILDEGESAVADYRKFLSSGCTQDPVSLLKLTGVDMSTSKPVDEALKVFEEQIARMEELSFGKNGDQ